mmetsp:Transcript_5557/g.6153  ORF Transcript_5557/g.6153 Transcript_5557/m.6153 type:complete len:163 (-) Transcript_5557:51-539(-)
MVDDEHEHETKRRTEKEEVDDDVKTDNKNNLVDAFVLWNHRRQQRKRNCRLQQKIAIQQEIISQAIIKQQQQHCPQQEHSISYTTSSSPIQDKNFSPITCNDTLQDSSSTINQSVDVHQLSTVQQPITTIIAHKTLLQQTETFVHSPTDCSIDPTENIWSID